MDYEKGCTPEELSEVYILSLEQTEEGIGSATSAGTDFGACSHE